MNYRMYKKLINYNLNGYVEIEIPESLIHIRIEPANYNSQVNIVGLECYGDSKYKKTIKLMVLSEVGTVEHTVDYEPKVFSAGTFTTHNGNKYYCFLLS